MPDEKFVAILERVRRAAARRILFLPHAVRQMSKPERLISAAEVRTTIEKHGEIIEDYPDDARGHSCLILARITANVPSDNEWDTDYKTRISQ